LAAPIIFTVGEHKHAQLDATRNSSTTTFLPARQSAVLQHQFQIGTASIWFGNEHALACRQAIGLSTMAMNAAAG